MHCQCCNCRAARNAEAQKVARPTKRLYKVPEAAEYLGMSPSQVRNLIALGKLRNVSLDSHARIAFEDLEQLVLNYKSL
jgi:excisionase family DNA binding protein